MPAEFPPPVPPPSSFAPPPGGRPAPAGGRTVEAGRGSGWWSDGWTLFRAAPGMWIAILAVYVLIVVGLSAIPWLGQIASRAARAGARRRRHGRVPRPGPRAAAARRPPLLLLRRPAGAAAGRIGDLPRLLARALHARGEPRLRRRRHGRGPGAAVGRPLGAGAVRACRPRAGRAGGAAAGDAGLDPADDGVLVRAGAGRAAARRAGRGDEGELFRLARATCCRCCVYSLIGLVLAIAASIPLGLGWLVLGPVFGGSVYAGYRDIFEPA